MAAKKTTTKAKSNLAKNSNKASVKPSKNVDDAKLVKPEQKNIKPKEENISNEPEKKKNKKKIIIPIVCIGVAAAAIVGGVLAWKLNDKGGNDHKGEKVEVELPTIEGVTFISEGDAKIGYEFKTTINVDTTKTGGLALPKKLPETGVRSGNSTLSTDKYTYTLDSNQKTAQLIIPGDNVVGNIQITFGLEVPDGYDGVKIPTLPGTKFSNIVSKVGEEFNTTITLDPSQSEGKVLPKFLSEGAIISGEYILIEDLDYEYIVNDDQTSASLRVYSQSVSGPLDISFELERSGLAASVVYKLTEGADTVSFYVESNAEESKTFTVEWGDDAVESVDLEEWDGYVFSHKFDKGETGDEFKISIYGDISCISFIDNFGGKFYESGNQHLTEVDIYKDLNNFSLNSYFGGYYDSETDEIFYSDINKINIYEGVTVTPRAGFQFINDLEEISLPSSLERIESNTFYGSEIKSVDIPSSVTFIGYDSFGDIYEYPEGYEPHKLREINIENTEENPSNLEEIDECAFELSGIKSFFVPKTVKVIDYSAFYMCEDLETFTFEENSSLVYLGTEAFVYCTSVSTITLPESLCIDEPGDEEGVGSYVFGGWTGEQSIYLPFAINKVPNSFDEYWAEGCDKNALNFEDPILPDESVELLYLYHDDAPFVAFDIEMYEENHEIFVDWGDGSKLEFGNDLIDYFVHEYEQTEENTPYVIKIYGDMGGFSYRYRDGYDADLHYYGYQYVDSVNIKRPFLPVPEGQTALEQHFGGFNYYDTDTPYAHVRNITLLASGMTAVTHEMFYSCDNIESVNFGSGITTICDMAFCDSTFKNKLILPSTITTLESVAFSRTNFIGGLELSKNLSFEDLSYDFHIFQGATFGGPVTFAADSIMTRIPNYLFSCVDLSASSIVIPKSVQEIGIDSFYLANLASLSFAADCSLTKIESEAFRGNKIQNLNIPSTVTDIGELAFYEIEELSSITFNENTEGNKLKIGWCAFTGCNISTLSLPSTVELIGYRSFGDCDNLDEVYCYATVPPTIDWGEGAGVSPFGYPSHIYVPASVVETYKADTSWDYFAPVIEAIPSNLM